MPFLHQPIALGAHTILFNQQTIKLKQEEFKTLFDKHFDTIRNHIYYRSGNQELATDIAQDTFMRIWEKQLKPEKGKEAALLYKIAGDLFVSRYRRDKLSEKYQAQLQFGYKEETPLDEMQYKELKTNYEKALSDLPEKQRLVFLMSRLEELKYHEIAQRLDISVKAVEKRMSHALLFLKKALLVLVLWWLG